MDDTGHVVVSYMGTDPGLPHAAAHADTKELDYEGMDQEHRRLLKMIRDATNGNNAWKPPKSAVVKE